MATFTVSTLKEIGIGSLNKAIQDANLSPGPHTINFTVSGTITLKLVPLPILTTSDVTINGGGQTISIVSTVAGEDCFQVDASSFNISNLFSIEGDRNGININSGTAISLAAIADIDSILGNNGCGIRINSSSSISNVTIHSCASIKGRGTFNNINTGNGIGVLSSESISNILISSNGSIVGEGVGGEKADPNIKEEVFYRQGQINCGNGIGFLAVQRLYNINISNNNSISGSGMGEANSSNGIGIYSTLGNSDISILDNQELIGYENSTASTLSSGNGVAIFCVHSSNQNINIANNTKIQGKGRGQNNSGNGIGVYSQGGSNQGCSIINNGDIVGLGISDDTNRSCGNGIGFYSVVSSESHNSNIDILNNYGNISGAGSGGSSSGNGIAFFSDNTNTGFNITGNSGDISGTGSGTEDSGNGIQLRAGTTNSDINISNNAAISGTGSGTDSSGNGISIKHQKQVHDVMITNNESIHGSGLGLVNTANGIAFASDAPLNADSTIDRIQIYSNDSISGTNAQSKAAILFTSINTSNTAISNVMIGGIQNNRGNTIHNSRCGILIESPQIVDNNISNLSVLGNSVLDLPDGAICRELPLTSKPVLISNTASISSSIINIIGTYSNALFLNKPFRIEFFLREYFREYFIGFTNVSTDSSGDASFNTIIDISTVTPALPPLSDSQYLIANATQIKSGIAAFDFDNTSAFSDPISISIS